MLASAERLAVRAIGPDESCAWDEFVSGAPNGNVLQSWAWGQFKLAHGWQPVRLALLDDDRIQAAAQVLFRSVSGLSMAYVPRGPVVPASRPDLYAGLLGAIHKLAQRRRSIFLKVEPNEPPLPELEQFLRDEGFVRSSHTPQPRATLFVDLHGGPDAVLARLKPKTRANVRKASKQGVEVRPLASDDDFRRFHELMADTGRRAGFPVRPSSYYEDVYREFHSRGQGELLLAQHQDQVVGGVVAYAYGPEGGGLYSASDHEYGRFKVNHLLQWRAMEWCMGRGCTRFDLWGIPERAAEHAEAGDASPEPLPTSGGLWGVYWFKHSFAEDPTRYIGAYDYPYIRPLYLLWSHLRVNKAE